MTYPLRTANFVEMHFAKPIVALAIVAALAAYAIDCDATTTAEDGMQCCNSMPCSSHAHHGQDCCKTMPTMHAPFVQPSSVSGVSFANIVLAVLPTSGESLGADSSIRIVVAQSHAPPVLSSLATPLPLRI